MKYMRKISKSDQGTESYTYGRAGGFPFAGSSKRPDRTEKKKNLDRKIVPASVFYPGQKSIGKMNISENVEF